MAQVKNITSGPIQVFAKGVEIGPGEYNFSLTLAAAETASIPDSVVNTSNVQLLVSGGKLSVLSYDTNDFDSVGSAELRSLIRGGTVTASSGTSTVVPDTQIKADDIIMVQAADTDFAGLTDVSVDPANIIVGTSFQVDHSSAAGTEKFTYLIRTA